ncbi:MAG: hypothetical protein HY810_01030 [Candidatus Omnitrophica bacterium]|nr:hypothetical protein [Candidatus Omnitrophota bacterium]
MKPFYLLIISILCFSVLLTGAKNADKNFPLFENTCGKCHKLERIFVIKKTTTGWNKTVDWMRRKNKNGFSQKDADKIKIHINNTHAYYTEQLFKQKCAECHPLDKITSLRLPAAQWHNLVLREQAKAITWIALDEAQDIADFLAKKFSRPETYQ